MGPTLPEEPRPEHAKTVQAGEFMARGAWMWRSQFSVALFVVVVAFAFLGAYQYATQNQQAATSLRWQTTLALDFTDYVEDSVLQQQSNIQKLRQSLVLDNPSAPSRSPRADEVENLLKALETDNRDMFSSIQRFKRDLSESRLPLRFAADLSLVPRAEAKPWKSSLSAPMRRESEKGLDSLLVRVNGFLWFLLIVPLVFGFCAMACLRSNAPDVRGFGMNMLTSIVGYYAGLGGSLFALAAG